MSIQATRNRWEKFKAADQAHDAEAISAMYAEDVVFTGTPLRGRAALKQLDATFYAAFPDYRREYLTEVIGDDTIAFVHHYTATHTGPTEICSSRPKPSPSNSSFMPWLSVAAARSPGREAVVAPHCRPCKVGRCKAISQRPTPQQP